LEIIKRPNYWKVLPPVETEPLTLATGLPSLIAQLLYHRGIDSPSQAELFFSVDERLQEDPFLLPDIEVALARIYSALLSGETIAVYGDFDADGICATALLVQGLSFLGGKVIPYIPHRLKEGYGLNLNSLSCLRQQGVSLVITVDCGISSPLEVERAKKLGMDVIITDHHTIPAVLPSALAVIDPLREDSSYPFSQLAGVGVAFKLLQALLQSLGKAHYLSEVIDLVAIGTVADIMPLLGENRYLVKKGLEQLNQTNRLGLQEMILLSGLKPGSLDSERISWTLAPRLNAAGRIAHALTSYQLLMTETYQEAHLLAQELEEKNHQRQQLTNEFLVKAKEMLAQSGTESPILVIARDDFPSGIAGLIAGRLVDEYYRPSLIIRSEQSICRGSARSIPEFNIIAALQKCQNLLGHFGGHPAAAGFTLPRENLPSFQQRLIELAQEQLSGVELHPSLTIDAEVPLNALNGQIFQLIQKFAPFGNGNPTPVFLSRGAKVIDCRTIGNNGDHLKLKLRQGNAVWEGVGFDLGYLASEITSPLDIVYHLTVDRWRENELLSLKILDCAPSQPC
jgi:single-stranded-DNA-specific exonuclease